MVYELSFYEIWCFPPTRTRNLALPRSHCWQSPDKVRATNRQWPNDRSASWSSQAPVADRKPDISFWYLHQTRFEVAHGPELPTQRRNEAVHQKSWWGFRSRWECHNWPRPPPLPRGRGTSDCTEHPRPGTFCTQCLAVGLRMRWWRWEEGG